MKNAIIVVLIAITLIACNATKIAKSENAINPKWLSGQWDWKKTTGGFAGITTSPETARYILHIEFKDGKLMFYKNNKVTQQYRYTITKDKTIFSTDSLYIINPDTTVNALPLVITKMVKDTIVLADNVNDGFSSTYVKRSN